MHQHAPCTHTHYTVALHKTEKLFESVSIRRHYWLSVELKKAKKTELREENCKQRKYGVKFMIRTSHSSVRWLIQWNDKIKENFITQLFLFLFFHMSHSILPCLMLISLVALSSLWQKSRWKKKKILIAKTGIKMILGNGRCISWRNIKQFYAEHSTFTFWKI